MIGKRLSLTGIARNIHSKAKEKHLIRNVDRLLSNSKLQNESNFFYKAICNFLINENTQPLVNVDWSCVNKRKDWHILRATLVLQGRGFIIYQEVHPRGCENSPKIEKGFLRMLKKIIPDNVKPIIVTDAGFRGTWFKEVETLGFDWIGRIRNKTCYRISEDDNWKYTYDLYNDATSKPKIIKNAELSKSNTLYCSMVLFKKEKKGRKHINLSGYITNNNQSNRCARRELEPWLIATSLPIDNDKNGRWIISCYKRRMQIEEDFRDTKSHQFGFGLRYSQTNNAERLKILLLIGMLCMFTCWIIALAAKSKRLHYDYQSNTVKDKTVLSVSFLACQLIRRGHYFRYKELVNAFEGLKLMVLGASLC